MWSQPTDRRPNNSNNNKNTTKTLKNSQQHLDALRNNQTKIEKEQEEREVR